MPLRSFLFQGDPKLEAAAFSDPAHIAPGQKGEHVAKIQMALNLLDNARLTVDSIYGPKTADAVQTYKSRRSIVNHAYQSSADNIVGRMTIAALDQELSDYDGSRPLRLRDLNGRPSIYRQPARPIATAGFVTVRSPSSVGLPAISLVRHAPGTRGKVTCENTFLISAAVCTNLRDPSYDRPKAVATRVAFISDLDGPVPVKDNLPVADGGRVPLSREPSVMRLECLEPGDAVISASRFDQSRLLFIAVRAGKAEVVDGPPLTKKAPDSDWFSDPAEREGTDPEDVWGGRPVRVNTGLSLINLGGEGETPGFKDYQVDLDHSFGHKKGFRPWTDDTDPAVFIPDKSASHITMRGVPMDRTRDNFKKVIERIAAPGCILTFSGSKLYEGEVTSIGTHVEHRVRGRSGDQVEIVRRIG